MMNSISLRNSLPLKLIALSALFLCFPCTSKSQEVSRDELRIHWTEDGLWMSYAVDAEEGQVEFFKVDLQTGLKSSLFEPERLRQLVEESGGATLDSEWRVYDAKLLDGGQAFRFYTTEGSFVCDEDFRITPTSASLEYYAELFTTWGRSRNSGRDSKIMAKNGLSFALHCFWLDNSGELNEYGVINTDETFAQNTYAGHLWSFRNEAGEEVLRIRTPDYALQIDVTEELLEQYKEFRSSKPSRRGEREQESTDGVFIRDANLFIQRDGQTNGQPEQLTFDGSEGDPYVGRLLVSPSGNYVGAIKEIQVEKRRIQMVEARPRGQLQPVVHEFEYVKPGDDLDLPRPRIVHVKTGKQVPILDEVFENPWSLSLIGWLEQPERLLCMFNRRGHQQLQVMSIDADSGEVKTIVDERSETFIDYSQKTYFELINAGRELLWASERNGFNHIYRFDTSTGELINQVTDGDWVVRDVIQFDAESQTLMFSACGIVPQQDPYYRHLCRVKIDGTGLIVLTEGDGDHRWEFSPDQRFFVDTFSRVDLAPISVLRKTEDGAVLCELESADWNSLVESGWTVPERFVAKGRDGITNIYGLIVRPKNFDAKRKYPVVEQIYAGPHSAHVPKAFGPLRLEHEIADLGFIVVRIDGMGTSHRGKKFHDMCYKNLADAGFPDRIAWIKAAAGERPEMDIERVGIFGGSAGGQNAMRALIDHGDFYDVAVADCGCHDNRMDKIWWNEAWMGWPIDESYEASSNVVHAHRLQGKLLLTVGELDRNVDPASTMQVVDALIKADKDFELLILPGAGHGAGELPFAKRKRAEFLKKHLLGNELSKN